jgi:rhamnosyltransferase
LEDIAWAQWAIESGYYLAYSAEAEVVHIHHETPLQVYNRYRREAMAFKSIYREAKFHLRDLVHLTTTNIYSDLVHAARQKLLWTSLIQIFWFRWMQFWGAYQGHRQPGALTWQLRQTFYYPRGISNSSQPTKRKIKPIQYKR